MSTNWFPGNNPESIPRYGYIPKIALPTVFGDALSYLEMIGRYNAEFNKAIDGINKLAENIEQEVQNSVENAKIPVYSELENNGSNIISPDNWNLSNPEDIYKAMQAGKMCILHANVIFNEYGQPVYDASNNMFFILTQFYQTVINSNDTSVRTVFVNYNETYVRVVKLTLKKIDAIYSAEVETFEEIGLPTEQEFELVYNLFKKCVFVYKGDVRIPDNSGQYIELLENATRDDLSTYFVVQDGGTMYVPDCTPAIVIDAVNGNIGELKFGGNETPWARIYSKGIKLYGYLLAQMRTDVDDNHSNIDDLGAIVDTLTNDVEHLSNDVSVHQTLLETLFDSVVKYTPQDLESSQKSVARNNIEAVARTDGVMNSSFTLVGSYWTMYVSFDNTQVAKTIVIGGDGGYPIIRGVADPVSADDVATKRYVDNHAGGGAGVSNGVSYDAQSPSATEKATARSNIGAVADENGAIVGYLSLQNGSENAVALVPGRNGVDDTLTFVGDNGDVLVRGVKTPELNSDAVNKQYCDTMKPLVMNLQNDGYSYSVDVTGDQIRAAIAERRPIYGVLADTDYPYLNNAVIAFNLMNPGGNNMDYLSAIVAGEGVKYQVIVEFHSSAYARYYITAITNNSVTNLMLADEERPEDYAVISYGQGVISFSDLGNTNYPVILHNLADGANARDAATKGYVDSRYSPYYVNINNGENAWSGTKDNAAISNLASVIRGYADGAKVVVSFPTTGVAGVGYAYPKCASLDYGIIVEAYNGTAWKRYVINSDGTVATTTL